MRHSTTRPPLRARHLWIGAVLLIAGQACDAGSTDSQAGAGDWDAARRRMVNEQLAARDIRSARVLDAMRRVPVTSCSRAQRGSVRRLASPPATIRRSRNLHRGLHDAGAGSRPTINLSGHRSGYWLPCRRLTKEVYTIEICAAAVIAPASVYRRWLSQRSRPDRQRASGGPGRAVRSHQRDRAPDEVPTAWPAIENRRVDGDPGGHRDAGAADPAPHRSGDGDAEHAPGAICPDDRQAREVGFLISAQRDVLPFVTPLSNAVAAR